MFKECGRQTTGNGRITEAYRSYKLNSNRLAVLHLELLLTYKQTKGEAIYAQCVFEVKCLQKEKQYKPEILAQAIRRSLRGEALKFS